MLEQAHRLVTWIAFAFVVLLATAELADADQLPDHRGQMIVENVWVTPAGAGGWSMLRLRITNESGEHAHLLGVEAPVSQSARIVGRIDDHRTTTLESINVRPHSVLDLSTDYVWIELGPLALAVKPGESIPLDLVFSRGRVRVDAHVHSADG